MIKCFIAKGFRMRFVWLATVMLFAACEGPAGPAGSKGERGSSGLEGEPGESGVA